MSSHNLSKKSIEIWKIYGYIEMAIYFVLLAILLIASLIWEWPLWIFGILVSLFIIFFPLKVKVFPYLLWKHFRYEISSEEIDIQEGILVIERTLMPITKIQKVSLSQGPILKKYELANVTIYNSTSEMTIPFMSYQSAIELRSFITNLVKETDDDK